jgi:hypothetical protein
MKREIKGLRIRGKGYPKKSHYRIDYNFPELISPVSDLIANYYWIIEDPIFIQELPNGDKFDDLQEKYSEIVLQDFPADSPPHFMLCIRGFLNKYGKFILPDNQRIFGLREKIDLSDALNSVKLNVKKSFISQNVEVFFSCNDAAYWEVYSIHSEILQRVKDKFPSSEEITLNDGKAKIINV